MGKLTETNRKPLRWHRYTEEYRKKVKIKILNENKNNKLTIDKIRQLIVEKLYKMK